MLIYFLDTDHCIHLLRRRPGYGSLQARLKLLAVGEVCMSVITEAELRVGADKSADPAKNHERIAALLTMIPSVPFDSIAAAEYGRLRMEFEGRGSGIGPNDTLIAAQARALRATLVSANLGEFSRVPGLLVESWI